ncbi:MAG TPA: 1-deoxy-D-xylulose-5-phosphate reductoisomerase [Actinobacteria bacterium]|nr:1-deoxy-D-xylulose-5-phosphate reductoisomerase [Actinomycetota bacterium]
MKRVTILGSTGSIGCQTVEIIKKHPKRFKVLGLSAHKNIDLLEEQLIELRPQIVAVLDKAAAMELKKRVEGKVRVLVGAEGLEELASLPESDLVVNAIVGSAGLDPTIAAIEADKELALANKESLVVGGEIVRGLVQKRGARVIPVDSEHSAIFQCLQGESPGDVVRLLLTGSGGPFRGKRLEELKDVAVEEALAHPRWKMGRKISIDSATLMNKGLEIIEAHFLFGIDYDRIEVVIHPQSIIHSMVEFRDGSIKAHLGWADMRIPIQYALSFPERLSSPLAGLDFSDLGQFTFEKPDLVNFPCLELALQAARNGRTYPAVLNAANEEAVAAFLDRRIPFILIPQIIGQTLDTHSPRNANDLSVLKEVERWARNRTKELIKRASEL